MINEEGLKRNILDVMEKREITLNALAIRSGISGGNLWKYINEAIGMKVVTLLKIADGLNINAGRLFHRQMKEIAWFKELEPFRGKVKDGVWVDEPVIN